ncbi:MAG: N-acetylmuramoyl-L-alanine amidase [Lachnospiraceae bacterium]|nr:N-acetylmuramoyl-L-alanine amidase [Lachnospiraceae bacterium]
MRTFGNKKRIRVMLLCLAFLFLLAACGKEGKGTQSGSFADGQSQNAFCTISTEKPETESPETSESAQGETAPSEAETTPEATAPPETESAYAEVNETVYATTSQVNVRKGPGTDAEKLGVLDWNEELLRTGVGENGWSRVTYRGETAYVYSEYLSTEKQERPASAQGIPGPGIYHEGSNGILVAIDAGHQLHGSSTKEPNGPGSSEMKARVTSGTSGCVSGLDEYQLNLTVAMKLRDALLAQGYSVLMIRETHEVDISNAERATLANEYGADIFLRVHANSSSDSGVNGSLTMAPSTGNPYCAGIAQKSQSLSAEILNHMCAQTGFRNRGVMITDTMTGINWCQMPVSIIEMGFMSNPGDDGAMASDSVQDQIVRGITDGVNAYFGR